MLDGFNLVPVASRATKVGDTFNRLIVCAVGRDKSTGKTHAICQCSCGSDKKMVRLDHLKSKKIDSCGCIYLESISAQSDKMNGHDGRWRKMMSRCYKKTDQAYSRYGGRGIKVCDRWHKSEHFALDVSEGHFKGAQLDRIDNNGNYSPENTRWATSKKNNNNRRDTIYLEYEGETKTISDWADHTGIKRADIWQRINNYGWTVERALTEKPKARMKQKEAAAKTEAARKAKAIAHDAKKLRVTYNGERYTMRELSDLCGVKIDLLRKRINERGWSVERAVINNIL